MNVPHEDLNALAETAFRINGKLLNVQHALRRAGLHPGIQNELELARQANVRIQHGLVRMGASDPLHARHAETRALMREAGLTISDPQEISLEHLSSPAAQRYARAMREAADACLAMEEERYGKGCDGFAEMLDDWAKDAEFEVHGPKGLPGWE